MTAATTIQIGPPTEAHGRLMLRVLRRVELRPHPEPGAYGSTEVRVHDRRPR